MLSKLTCHQKYQVSCWTFTFAALWSKDVNFIVFENYWKVKSELWIVCYSFLKIVRKNQMLPKILITTVQSIINLSKDFKNCYSKLFKMLHNHSKLSKTIKYYPKNCSELSNLSLNFPKHSKKVKAVAQKFSKCLIIPQNWPKQSNVTQKID